MISRSSEDECPERNSESASCFGQGPGSDCGSAAEGGVGAVGKRALWLLPYHERTRNPVPPFLRISPLSHQEMPTVPYSLKGASCTQ